MTGGWTGGDWSVNHRLSLAVADILDGDDGAEKLDTTLACLRDDQIGR